MGYCSISPQNKCKTGCMHYLSSIKIYLNYIFIMEKNLDPYKSRFFGFFEKNSSLLILFFLIQLLYMSFLTFLFIKDYMKLLNFKTKNTIPNV